MNPWLMASLLVAGFGAFAYQMWGRIRLWSAKARESGFGDVRVTRRLARVVVEGLGQARLPRYRGAGFAHIVLFWGFLTLLLRTIVLFGRGFEPGFQLLWFAPSDTLDLGSLYGAFREFVTVGVVLAASYFLVVRAISRPSRLSYSREAQGILITIILMMVADLLYDAAGNALASRHVVGPSETYARFVAAFAGEAHLGYSLHRPVTSGLALGLSSISTNVLLGLGLIAFHTHVVLVLGFLNVLPNSKHFHVLLALPNLFLSARTSASPTRIAADVEDLLSKVEAAVDESRPTAASLGKSRIEDFSIKDRLEWFTCTECGRCSDHCPAHRSGKPLSPKAVTLALRERLKAEAPRLLGSATAAGEPVVPSVIDPAALWACTNCRACEEQCPVGVRYLDTITDLRRDMVMMRGEVPPTLPRVFDAMERNKNPWNFPNRDRLNWASGLDVPLISEVEHVEYLYWVGCAASFDERNRRVARALVKLMQRARIRFAILGGEEHCTGDSARRAGNELLFLTLAEHNIATLNRYRTANRFERIITTCPHCLTTLGRDYADFGGKYDVESHTVALARWFREGRLTLDAPRTGRLENPSERIVFHDPCTLARHVGVVDDPRQVLRSRPGTELLEPEHHGKETLCCGAGGAQMWLEEAGTERMNSRRARELLRVVPDTIVSACPFCLTMVSDGCAEEWRRNRSSQGDFGVASSKRVGKALAGKELVTGESSGQPSNGHASRSESSSAVNTVEGVAAGCVDLGVPALGASSCVERAHSSGSEERPPVVKDLAEVLLEWAEGTTR
ncbi:MAG: (Fe-S)-binding protein [Polyangiaceae bacterium]